MSWSEGRARVSASSTDARRAALDRVDGLLRGLARDQLLQDDLKHADVQKALEHWTGRKRLSQEDADELMEDNYRIQSVCTKMAELQSCCKMAGIGLPLSQVIAGKGLYDSNEPPINNGGSSVGPNTNHYARGDDGDGANDTGVTRRRPQTPSDRASPAELHQAPDDDKLHNDTSAAKVRQGTDGNSPARPRQATAEGSGEGGPSWKQALLDEVWRAALVCVSAILFTLLLKHFRGDDPLGLGKGNGDAGSTRQDEL